MSIREIGMTIRSTPARIGDELPKLRGLEDGPWRVENPGMFPPGKYVIRVDDVAKTARIDPREAA